MTDTTSSAPVSTDPELDPAPRFLLEECSSVSLTCPWCFEALLLTDDECPTLGDVIAAANAHDCND